MFTRRQLVQLILPLVAEQFLAITIGLADTVMVSSVGEAAVSGISVVDAINVLLIQVFAALSTGGAVVAAQYIGSGNPRSAGAAAKQLLYVSAFFAVIIMTACLSALEPILRLVYGDLSPDVLKNALAYFQYTVLAYPFLAVYSAGAALFRAMGNSRVSMLVSLGVNIVNISLNAVFIYGCGMGAKGAAVATLISQAVAAAVITVLLCRSEGKIRVDGLFHFRPDFSMIGRILHIGVPNGLEGGMFQIGKLIVQRQITAFGTSAIAANAVAGSVSNLANIPNNAMSLALLTVVGQCVGAGDYRQAVSYTKRFVGVTYAAQCAVCLPLFLFAGPIVGIYRLNPSSAATAALIARTFAVANAAIVIPAFTLPNALRAAGDARFTMVVSTVSMWVFRIGFSFLLIGFGLQVLGVWYAMYIDWFVRAAVFIVRFRGSKWKTKKVI